MAAPGNKGKWIKHKIRGQAKRKRIAAAKLRAKTRATERSSGLELLAGYLEPNIFNDVFRKD